jgi:hypothetical protein
MRPKFLIFLLAVVVVMLTVIFWRRPVESPTDAKQAQAAVQTNNVPVVSGSIASQSTPVGANPMPVTSTNLKSQPSGTNQAGLKEAIEKLVEGRNKPIRFYGQVIDQNSNGLSGVEIKSVVQQITMPDSLQGPELIGSKYITVVRTTGADGRFEISGLNGDGFGIGLTKDGYEAEPDHRSFGQIGGSYDNPVIFKMWSTNIHEQLITGNKSFDIVPDGRPYFINLTDDTISESGNGDLKVWVQYMNQPVRGQLYDWSAGIEVINGGLLEKGLGSPMYDAPTDGYVPTFEIHGKLKGGQRGDSGERQFYLKLKNGQEFGQMSIDLHAPFNDQTPGLIRLSYAINPSGSRILR